MKANILSWWPSSGDGPLNKNSLVERVRKYFSSPVSFFNDDDPHKDPGRLVYATIKGVEWETTHHGRGSVSFFTLNTRPTDADNWETTDDPVARIEAMAGETLRIPTRSPRCRCRSRFEVSRRSTPTSRNSAGLCKMPPGTSPS